MERPDKKKTYRQMTWEFIGKRLVGTVIAFAALLFLIYFQGHFTNLPIESVVISPTPEPTPEAEVSQISNKVIKFRDADIVFQSLPDDFSRHISEITESPLTHCGLISINEDKVFVIETTDEVTRTPLQEWIGKGKEKKFALMRYPDLKDEQEIKIIKAANEMMGRKYDYQFSWDDEKLYCSELVFKAYTKGIGVKLGKLVPLKNLKYESHEDFIRSLTGEEIPLDRKVITPVEIYRNRELVRIYDDFIKMEPRKEKGDNHETEDSGNRSSS